MHECGTKEKYGQIILKDGYIFQVSTYKCTIKQVDISYGIIIV